VSDARSDAHGDGDLQSENEERFSINALSHPHKSRQRMLTVIRKQVLYTSLAVRSLLKVSQRTTAGGIVHFAWLVGERNQLVRIDLESAGREAHTSQ
jgi:hypothetical protein